MLLWLTGDATGGSPGNPNEPNEQWPAADGPRWTGGDPAARGALLIDQPNDILLGITEVAGKDSVDAMLPVRQDVGRLRDAERPGRRSRNSNRRGWGRRQPERQESGGDPAAEFETKWGKSWT